MIISPDNEVDLERIPSRLWDCVVVGSGMGGGVAAYALASKGLQVLLIEKGYSACSSGSEIVEEQSDSEERLKFGKWPTQLTAQVDNQQMNFWAPLGCGLGGTSQLYAAALQRLEQVDLNEQTLSDGRTLKWPYSYREIEPYYLQAEQLFSVCGTQNPLESYANYQLNDPPAMCEADNTHFDLFKRHGLNPYRLHVGAKYEPGCMECGGKICPRDCKQSSLNSCISPALRSGNLHVASQCEVLSLDADEQKVNHLDVRQSGRNIRIEAKYIVLSAGAYFTPIILQKSKSRYWPNGLGNQHDLVGRNLMFHASDFIAVWPKAKASREGAKKTIALRDFYCHDGEKLGEFQSTGMSADYGNVLYALRRKLELSVWGKVKGLHHFLRIPAYLAAKIYGAATLFATIVEDLPYLENRVIQDPSTPSGMRFEYTVRDELKERVMAFRQLIRKSLASTKVLVMDSAVSLNYGHPCGTCCYGDVPEHGVVDRDCKVYGVDNLYIADASFMPTSGGTNPSLTIAANALRVADKVANKYHAEEKMSDSRRSHNE